MNTPAEAPSTADPLSTSSAESDAERLRAITKQLVQDVRPLAERVRPVLDNARPLANRARRWADVMLPLVDELRPLHDDLRPVVEDVGALSRELVLRVNAAASRLQERFGPIPVGGFARIVGAHAHRVAIIRLPQRAAPPETMRAPRAAAAMRVPSIGPRLAAVVRSVARRLRPGRWAFRTIAIGIIATTAINPTLRDAVVEQVDWTRSALQTMELPAVQLPVIELPKIELPNIELPAIQMPAFELPTFQLTRQGPAAPAKLAPAQFELPPLNAYRAVFETQATYPTVAPNAPIEWVVALRNTGSVGWYRGVAGAQAALALTDGTEVAVQSTAYVGPGQVGWFVVHLRAPAGSGTHSVPLFPRIDGRGELPDLGIFALVTVR